MKLDDRQVSRIAGKLVEDLIKNDEAFLNTLFQYKKQCLMFDYLL